MHPLRRARISIVYDGKGVGGRSDGNRWQNSKQYNRSPVFSSLSVAGSGSKRGQQQQQNQKAAPTTASNCLFIFFSLKDAASTGGRGKRKKNASRYVGVAFALLRHGFRGDSLLLLSAQRTATQFPIPSRPGRPVRSPL